MRSSRERLTSNLQRIEALCALLQRTAQLIKDEAEREAIAAEVAEIMGEETLPGEIK